MFFSHLDEPTDDVLGQLKHLSLSKLASFLEQPTQVTLVTVLSDDIAVRCLADYIVATQDIGVSEAS